MNSPADHLIEAVAAARLALDEAAADHAEHNREAAALLGRIGQCQARQGEITRCRLSGQQSQDEANEYAALAGDLVVLRELHSEAQAKAEASRPERQRAALARAEADLVEYQHSAAFEQVIEHARAAERIYVECLRAVWEAAGQQQGRRPRTFGDMYRIDQAIMNLCRHNSFQGLEAQR